MKKISFTIFSFVFSFGLFAGEKFQISISPEMGMYFGQIREHVFDFDGTERYLMSRLDWDIDPMPFCGIKVGLDVFKHLELKADGRIGYTGRCGQMQDYDWMGSDKTKNTHYSWHENYLENYVAFSAQIGWKINLKEGALLTPSLMIRGENFYFSGWNGYSQYAWDNKVEYWHEDLLKKDMTGNVISYRQNRFFGDVGWNLSVPVTSHFMFSYSFFLGIYHYITGHDFHNLREDEFLDVIYGYGLSEVIFHMNLTYKINKNNIFDFKIAMQEVPLLIGDTYQKKFDRNWSDGDIFKNGGGASSTIYSLGVNYTLKF